MHDDQLHATTMYTLNIIDLSIVYLHTSSVPAVISAVCEAIVVILSVKHRIWEAQAKDQSDAAKNSTLLVSKRLQSPVGILPGIFHNIPSHNIQVNVFTKYRFYIYKTLTYINRGVVNKVPTQTEEDPITVDTTDEYYTSVISPSYNSQSRQ